MAGVDHAYQYSVEVKSRFSLFLNDALNDEDPDLLISKLQTERSGRHKKEKPRVVEHVETCKLEDASESKPNTQAPKAARTPKPVPIPVTTATEDVAPPAQNKSPSGDHVNAITRGRGGLRGFGRARGRGQGPRLSANDENADSAAAQGDYNQRDVPFEPRGRGRGRGRGGFTRGRGAAYTDYREMDRVDQRRPYRRDDPGEPNDGGEAAQPDAGDMHHVESTEVDAQADVATEENPAEDAIEEEPKSYTLEEYKALRSHVKPAVTLNVKATRKPNDGKDVFKNMVAHKKVNEVSDDELEEIEHEPEESQTFEIDVSFTDRRNDRGRGRGFNRGGFDRGRGFRGEGRARGARGTRGGSRGESRGRGFSRGINYDQHAAPPVIYSDQDFPTLK